MIKIDLEVNETDLINRIEILERMVTVVNRLIAKIEQENKVTFSGKTISERLTHIENLYKINLDKNVLLLPRIEEIINFRNNKH